MAEHVEGDFKHFVFKMLKPEDYPKALTHLRKVFYKEEPSCKISELGDEEYELIDKYVLFHLNLNDDLSFYVEEKATGKVSKYTTLSQQTTHHHTFEILHVYRFPGGRCKNNIQKIKRHSRTRFTKPITKNAWYHFNVRSCK